MAEQVFEQGVGQGADGQPEATFDWAPVWAGLAQAVATHWAAGRAHLVTDQVMRLYAAQALQAAGVHPSRTSADVVAPAPHGVEVGLVLDGLGEVVVELGNRVVEGGSDALPMGDLVRDLLQVALVPAGRRWVVQVQNARLMRYLASAAARSGFPWPVEEGAQLLLDHETLDALPPSAAKMVDGTTWRLPVLVTCTGVWPVWAGHSLYAFDVATPSGLTSTPRVEKPVPVEQDGPVGQPAPGAAPVASPQGTPRAQVLDAVRDLVLSTGEDAVRVEDVVARVRERGSRLADAQVVAMLTTHMCADVQGRGIASYDDVDRLPDGGYRLREWR